MEILETLKNMGFAGLSELCNPAIIGIINEFHEAPDVAKLSALIKDIYGEHSLLQSTEKRRHILAHLKKDQAIELCNKLGISLSEHENPWTKLSNLRFTEEKTHILLTAFGISPYQEDEEEPSNIDFCRIVKSSYPLFPHQEAAAQEIKVLLEPQIARVLLHMPTGSGKTRTSMSIACDYIRNGLVDRRKSVVVWLADTEELCDQAASEFEKAWVSLGVGETNLYRVHGSVHADLSQITHGFVVIGLQKLNSISQSQQNAYYKLCNNTSLVIFDEAHKAVAETYRHAVEVFQTAGKAKLLGLSATPGRSTYDREENEKFAEFFNFNKVSLKVENFSSPIEYLQSEGYLAAVSYTDIPYTPSAKDFKPAELAELKKGNEPADELLKRLGLDEQRNLKILLHAMKLVNEGKKTILFTASVESAEALFALLRYKGIKAGLITGKTDSLIRKKYINDYKIGSIDILVNYGVLTTGFDAPITSAAIIARPTNSLTLFSQMVGRAIRGERAGGNKHAEIYVIKDTLPGLRDMTKAFSHWDESWGY